MRIGAHLSGLERQLLTSLSRANAAAAQNSLRLATGHRLNSAKDDPAAFFQLSSLTSRLSVVNSAAKQVEAAAGVSASLQLTLDKVRTQLNTLRAALVADTASSQASVDAAILEVNRLAGAEINGRRLLDGSANFRVSGQNTTQVRSVSVVSLGGPTQVQAREQAELIHTGANRKLAADANLTLTGNLGSYTLDVAQDESLSDVAARINQQTLATGVAAEATGNELAIRSVGYGSSARAEVVVNSGTFLTTGGAGDGTARGVDPVVASGSAIAGKVLSAASQAILTYTGAGGQIDSGIATFTLTGQRGSVAIDVAANQDLSEVADAVNAESHATGVTAAVDGDDLIFTTVNYGTDATLAIEATSGAFAVTGGNNDGTAQGVNAVAMINGRTYRGDTAAQAAGLVHTELDGQIDAVTFTLTGGLGSHQFAFGGGTTLADVASAVNLETGATGIQAEVSADGFDLIFTSTTQGAAAELTIEVTDGAFSLTPTEGATVSSAIPWQRPELHYESVDGTIADNATFDLEGLLGTEQIVLTAGQTLAEAADLINAQTINTGIKAEVLENTLTLTVQNDAGSTAFVDVNVTAGTFAVSGGDGNGHSDGVNASTTLNGSDALTGLTGVSGNRFTINDNGNHFTVEFAGGFQGAFDTISLSDDPVLKFALSPNPSRITSLGLGGVQAAQLGGISGRLDQLATGGLLAGLGNHRSAAIRVVDEALAQLTLQEGLVEGFADASVASSASLLDGLAETLQDSINNIDEVNEEEESLLQVKNQQLVANALASLTLINQQRQSLVAIIQQIAGLK